jgi:hypothetical protein
MMRKNWKAHITLWVLLVVAATAIPAFGGAAVVGSVAGSMNATISGQVLLPNTIIFSGDSLQVKDGAAVVAVGSGSRLVFGRETEASFLRDANEVTVLLGQGNVSLYRAAEGTGLRVKVGEVSILPAAGYKTLGEVALLGGTIVVTAKEGKLRVEGNGPAVEVVKGKTITLARPARGPQGAGSGSAGVSSSTALQIGAVAAGGTSAVLSGVAMSRSGDARDAAAAANATAAEAIAAGQAAEAAAQAAEDAVVAEGCALDTLARSLGQASPYTPPEGYTCP